MALTGNTMALYLADMLLDAIEELGSTLEPDELLNQLRGKEDADYEKFFQSKLPDDIVASMAPIHRASEEFCGEVDFSHFYRSPSICRTARLPSQSRYMGIMTESKETGIRDYYKGLPLTEVNERVMSESIGNATMPLVYNPSDRQNCEVELNMDYKDFFYTTSKQGWSTLTIPNEVEKRAYGRESEKLLGLVFVCLVVCDWGRCPEGDLQHEAIVNGTLQLEVNGQPATNVTPFDMCLALRGENGYYWQPNADGQFVLGARALGDGQSLSYVRFSSLLVL